KPSLAFFLSFSATSSFSPPPLLRRFCCLHRQPLLWMNRGWCVKLKLYLEDKAINRKSEKGRFPPIHLSQTHHQIDPKLTSERARRRRDHLAKLGEHADGFSKRKFLMLHRNDAPGEVFAE
ncbi:hypothetical protein AKJ16_DCAP15913, partial [Drosera capensis]